MRDDPSPMAEALRLATLAAVAGEVPVGAVVTDAITGRIIAAAHNRVETDRDPTAHAEILAIRAAAVVLGEVRLTGCDLWVTLEPCPMCAQAIAFARLRRLVFAAYDPKAGGVEHGPRIFTQPGCNHRPEVIGGVREAEASVQLRKFFEERR